MSQQLIMRLTKVQMARVSRGLSSEVFGKSIRDLLTNTVRSIVADDDRKNYTFTFDLDNAYIGQTPEKQRENLREIFNFLTAPTHSILRVETLEEPCRYDR